jgi:DNA-binding MarR family transcriptional regulator
VTAPELSEGERRLLRCLLTFYEEIGPAAVPAVRELHEEAGLEPWEIPAAVKSLRARGLIEYWELQPAVRLTPEGLGMAKALPQTEDA